MNEKEDIVSPYARHWDGVESYSIPDWKKYYSEQVDIIEKLAPHAQTVSLRAGTILRAEEQSIWLLTDQSVEVRRAGDDLLIGMTAAPVIFGLGRLLDMPGGYYCKTLNRGNGYKISQAGATRLINKYELWKSVAKTVSSHLCYMLYRDRYLTGKDSYHAIKMKLLEYYRNKELFYENEIGVISYIKDSTFLSRSMIYRTLSLLVEKGYIALKKGMLVSVYYLPERI
ncbi:hypothetical protein GCM10011513_10180 [Franconibacter daqui]|uniref:helix-turn-helix domain-containing protein n=1 Tax=Franconibacter daqui TaxID=2047724 RepID=UPI00166665C3|nr:helix-turn-helix domain-containing protein [Franconibacter daqui]GGD14648.1 hypothetical protein GCM10011513_10180 [Franconibacter daqui]